MKNKKAFEMTISTVVVMVLALILLAVGIYIIYSKILKPVEGTTSVLDCSARGGTPQVTCDGCASNICLKLPGGNPYCCINSKQAS
ncbi:MAG: hypothetical protein AABW88_02435 [Nanoarchaeota archaeon]